MTVYSHTPRFISLVYRLKRVKSGYNRNKQPYIFQGLDGGPNFLRDVLLLSIFYRDKERNPQYFHLSLFCMSQILWGILVTANYWLGLKLHQTHCQKDLDIHIASSGWLSWNQSQYLIISEKPRHISLPQCIVAMARMQRSKWKWQRKPCVCDYTMLWGRDTWTHAQNKTQDPQHLLWSQYNANNKTQKYPKRKITSPSSLY